MNIFFLDEHTGAAARYHCDKHVVKMILESAQLLSTAHHAHNPLVVSGDDFAYTPDGMICRMGWMYHPCSVWTRTSDVNYCWLHDLAKGLLDEYTHRYGRVHAMAPMLGGPLASVPVGVPLGPLTAPVQAMPAPLQGPNAVHAYRLYYATHKARFAKWTKRSAPYWWEEYRDLAAEIEDV